MRFSCIAWLTVLLQAPLAAQTPQSVEPPPTEQEVVVTGARDSAKDVQAFVEALTAVPGGSRAQLSRFETRAVCPTVLGVSATQRAAIVARMRRVAAAAGAPLAGARCLPNIVLAVVPEKRAFIELLARRDPDFLGALSAREVRRLAESPGPAAAWQIAGPLLNADGVEIPNPGPAADNVAVNRTGRAASRISAAARPQVAAAMVVVESAALNGFTITQIADYWAIRALGHADPAALAGSSAPTILTMLDVAPGSATPVTLTNWDLQFLKALYAAPSNIYAPAQRSQIRRDIERNLRQGPPSDASAAKR